MHHRIRPGCNRGGTPPLPKLSRPAPPQKATAPSVRTRPGSASCVTTSTPPPVPATALARTSSAATSLRSAQKTSGFREPPSTLVLVAFCRCSDRE